MYRQGKGVEHSFTARGFPDNRPFLLSNKILNKLEGLYYEKK